MMIKLLFWTFTGMTSFIYFGYPLCIWFAARIFGRDAEKGRFEPLVTLIIPMHNEESVAGDKAKNVLSLDYPKDKLEAIFALDDCTDSTFTALSGHNSGGFKILDYKGRAGKVAVLNCAARDAKGEIIVFSDANSIYDKNALRPLVRNFSDPQVGCVCGRLKYVDADATSVGKGENLYWRYENFLKRQESRLGMVVATNGSIQAVRKALYPYPDNEVADDFSIPLLVQAKGYKVLYEPDAVAHEVATQDLAEEFEQKVRIVSQGLKGTVRLWRYLVKLSPLGLAQLLMHKILRWGIPLYLFAAFSLNALLIEEPLYRYTFTAQACFYLLASVGFLLRHKMKAKIFYIPFYFCLVNASALTAMARFLRNGDTHIWEKAATTRRKSIAAHERA